MKIPSIDNLCVDCKVYKSFLSSLKQRKKFCNESNIEPKTKYYVFQFVAPKTYAVTN